MNVDVDIEKNYFNRYEYDSASQKICLLTLLNLVLMGTGSSHPFLREDNCKNLILNLKRKNGKDFTWVESLLLH